jgi:hypothetical protein
MVIIVIMMRRITVAVIASTFVLNTVCCLRMLPLSHGLKFEFSLGTSVVWNLKKKRTRKDDGRKKKQEEATLGDHETSPYAYRISVLPAGVGLDTTSAGSIKGKAFDIERQHAGGNHLVTNRVPDTWRKGMDE